MANNDILFNAAVAGIGGAIDQRWIVGTTPIDYIRYHDSIEAFATAVDAAIPPGSPDEGSAKLLQSICIGVLSNRDIVSVISADYNNIAVSIAALYTELLSLLFPEGGGGGGAVSSVFGRAGVVIAALNDYVASLVGNDSTVLGGTGTTKDALNTLLALIIALNSNDVDNSSTVAGTTISDALNTLKGAAGGVYDFVDSKLVAPAEVHYSLDANTTITPGTDGPGGKPCMRYYFNPVNLTANRVIQFAIAGSELGFYVNVIQLRKSTAGNFRYQFLDASGANLFNPEPALAITVAGYYLDARFTGTDYINDANHFVYWDY